MEGSGEIHLTAEEHTALAKYLSIKFRLEDRASAYLFPRTNGRGCLSEKSTHPLINAAREALCRFAFLHISPVYLHIISKNTCSKRHYLLDFLHIIGYNYMQKRRATHEKV